jgi:hypothetical protein
MMGTSGGAASTRSFSFMAFAGLGHSQRTRGSLWYFNVFYMNLFKCNSAAKKNPDSVDGAAIH